jgi:hypothetical protein
MSAQCGRGEMGGDASHWGGFYYLSALRCLFCAPASLFIRCSDTGEGRLLLLLLLMGGGAEEEEEEEP